MKLIEKENIPSLNFVNSCVDIDSIKVRLKKAEQLGNGFKRKSKILFKTLEGVFKVETTVWATTENHVVLKGGVLIPINCIDSVNFY